MADAKSYSDTASAKIDRLAETVSRNDAARSSEINTLTAKLENFEVGGRNYALSTAAADKILTVSGNNQTKSVTLDVSSSLDLKQGDALIIACDLDIVNATSMFGKSYPRIGVELSVTYSDNTIGYFSAWYDEAVKDEPKTLSSSCKERVSPSSPGVDCFGARLTEDLKWMLPKPPLSPLARQTR